MAEPQWLALYRARAEGAEVAQAWLGALEEEERKEAEADPPAARAKLRRAIVNSECPEVRADANKGWKYTGQVLRAADAALGIAAPKPSAAFGAPSGAGAPQVSRVVVPGEGKPGTLGLWWSDFEAARSAEQLRGNGITHRLNVAAEAVGKFQDDGIVTAHVPMQDVFDMDSSDEAIAEWKVQFAEALSIMRGWREAGAVVNISCQMGKNRSGCSVMLWLCAECGWGVEEAATRLREITALACGNPHLVKAVSEFLGVDASVPLNPAGDGGGWVCISPPGSPRDGGTQAFEDNARLTLEKLAQAAAAKKLEEDSEEEPAEEHAGDMEGLFEGM